MRKKHHYALFSPEHAVLVLLSCCCHAIGHSEDYSSGYSDGGGGLEEGESVYDIIDDSDDEYSKTTSLEVGHCCYSE